MHYVYLIKSVNCDFTYIGQTEDLKSRLLQHNAGKEPSTKAYAPYKLIYYEAYANKKDALIRENKLKQFGSTWGHLRKRIKFSL